MNIRITETKCFHFEQLKVIRYQELKSKNFDEISFYFTFEYVYLSGEWAI